MPKKYVRIVQDVYLRSKMVVICNEEKTEIFPVEVGVHQRSALSSCLFALLMDYLTNLRRSAPWNMMFADDIVLCAENMKDVELQLEEWRRSMEGYGMKVSRTKTKYMSTGR